MDHILAIIHGSNFYEFATLLVLSAIAAIIASCFRQPLIVAFIIIGIIAGPATLGIVQSGNEILLLAKLGIAILLFIVGLKLDLKLIRNLGSIAAIIGLGQVVGTILAGMALAILLGFSAQSAFLIGLALSFSSTIIIIKILSDKREIDSLHGQIALGVLIIQDLVVVFSMIILAAFSSSGADADTSATLFMTFMKLALSSALLLLGLGIFMRYAAQRLLEFIAKNQELLLCFAIAWAVMLAALCDFMGLSKELGGLLAGISLASTPYREAIISRLSSLRDFLLLFFFISLGTQLDLAIIQNAAIPALILSFFVLTFKPLIIMTLCGFLDYRKRTGFLAGLSLAQISEFSLIFSAMAFHAGFFSQDILGIITLTGIITIMVSTYLIALSQPLYHLFENSLNIFERSGQFSGQFKEQQDDVHQRAGGYDIILFGLGRYGKAMANEFIMNNKTVLAVDFSPEEVKKWRTSGRDAIYGDANDPEFYHTLPLKKAQWIVSALPQLHNGIAHEDTRLIMLHALKEEGFTGHIAVACHSQESAEKFEALGIQTIFLPFHDAAQKAVEIVLSVR